MRRQQEEEVISSRRLVDKHEEALDFLLHQAQELRHRINSLGSGSGSGLRDQISPDKVEKMHLMSSALVKISELINATLIPPSEKKNQDNEISSLYFHRTGWKSTWASSPLTRGAFHDITTSSPMQFTHCTPGSTFPYSSTVGAAYQIYSIKFIDLNAHLDWPLYVYGVVAVRDSFDHNRNILFSRSKANCQQVTQADPFLHLNGPVRAIVAEKDQSVQFEVELKIKYGAKPKDTALFTSDYNLRSIMRYSTIQINGECCKAELSLERLTEAVQATIVGVRLVKGEWPFKYGCQVSCFLSPIVGGIDSIPMEVVLLKSRAEQVPAQSDGYIHLSRKVVSVELQSTLKVSIQAYSDAGSTPLQGHVNFPVQQCQISKQECSLDNSTVMEIIVAWSRLPVDEFADFQSDFVP